MNQVGEKINLDAAKCREMYANDLVALLNSQPIKRMSWGASAFTVDKKKQPKMFRMFVRGYKHTGHVYIFLNGMDLFDVYLTTAQGTIKERTGEMGIYGDTLIDWIDEKVEKQPDYSF